MAGGGGHGGGGGFDWRVALAILVLVAGLGLIFYNGIIRTFGFDEVERGRQGFTLDYDKANKELGEPGDYHLGPCDDIPSSWECNGKDIKPPSGSPHTQTPQAPP